jgi:acetyltransferase-like isoleucine patch superfamily enzyme
MSLARFEPLFTRIPRGFMSRLRLFSYKCLGMKAGRRNRLESIRCRRLGQIELGEFNSLTDGCRLWPEDTPHNGVRIRIGNYNYFNRNVMIDACGHVEVGDHNMFGPDIYITDSNHSYGRGITPGDEPMQVGSVKIGNRCWIGAHAIILKDVELGDHCVVGAGAVVTRSFPAGSVIAGVPARSISN